MSDLRAYFFELTDRLVRGLAGAEVLLATFAGEDSDFVRFNRNRVRQAGGVRQRSLGLDLAAGRRHARATCELAGDMDEDLRRAAARLESLRAQRAYLPEDPYLNYAGAAAETQHHDSGELPPGVQAIAEITRAAAGLDLVGLWAAGPIHRGFADSQGGRHWHTVSGFDLDWSCHLQGDKAVKAGYAGTSWDPAALQERMDAVRGQLAILERTPRTIGPGRYRAYLTPQALREVLEVLGWGGFGLKAHRTAQSPLIRMARDGRTLSPAVSLTEHHAAGMAPRFTPEGFVTPERVELIERGRCRERLADARSAAEYGATVNAAEEHPGTLEMAAGDIPRDRVLERLGTGVYIGNLWYANYSDRAHARITGMTRFASFWVEDGAVRAPLSVMRFDETVYRMLGERLEGLTVERELIHDSGTYDGRSTTTYRLPGALIDGLTFTL